MFEAAGTGDVAEHLETVELGHCTRHRIAHACRVHHVTDHRKRGTAGFANQLNGFAERLLVDVGARDPSTLDARLESRDSSDAGTGTGDEESPTLEALAHSGCGSAMASTSTSCACCVSMYSLRRWILPSRTTSRK